MKATIVYEGKATKEFDEMFNFAKKKLSKLEFKRKKSSTDARFVLYYKDLAKVVYPNEKNEPLHKAIVRELANYGFKYGSVDISKEKNFSENALTVLQERYLLKDETRKPIETPEQLFRRVARNLAFVDLLYGRSIEHCEELAEKFFQIMYNKYFLPNTPTLANAGKPNSLLSACFVLPVEDSIESIFNSARDGALVHRQGGGTGYAFSKLRPEGSIVKSTGGRASGPVSFMYAFNVYTDVVKQGGIRRGANMGVLNVHHPDIMKFINAKVEPDEKAKKVLKKLCQLTGLDEEHPFIGTTKKLLVENYQLNNFNISVAVTDRFMEALAKNEDYELIDPRKNEVVGKLNAAEVFEAICKNTWLRGDPGIVFIDSVNKDNPTPAIGKIESTNPCGEQPLLPYESCNLGSINLSKFVKDNGIDWQKLRGVVRLAVHFLDNVIDANSYPIKQIEIMTKANRKIGLGVMGWADMLIDLGISYASNEALELAEEVMSFIKKEALEKSKELAKEKGVFPNWEKSVFKEKNIKLRNATLTTIAPTGSISMIADCSAGVEPLFSLAYIKTVLGGKQLHYVNERFIKLAKDQGFYSKELEDEILEKGNLSNVNNVPDDVKKLFVTALEIPAEWHIKMQAAFQKYTDNAVSKTINLPEDASVEDIKNCYKLAYELGCKGLTIYRDKSLFEQVVNFKVKDNEVFFRTKPKERPAVVYGMTRRIKVPCGNLFITINLDENKEPFEVFITAGKAGGCLSANTEAIGRLISYILRTNPDSWTHLENIVGQLRGIGCGREVGFGKNKVLSCPDAVAIELYKFLVEANKVKDELPEKFDSENFESPFKKENNNLIDINIQMGACPNCGSPLIFQEGCAKCTRCNYTQCD